jgi:hypothetical protein
VQDIGLDGWNHQYTYVVLQNATGNNAFTLSPWQTNAGIVLNDDSTPVNQISNDVVVMLISHGENGNGSLTVDGVRMPQPPAGALGELENLWDPLAPNDLVFVRGTFSRTDAAPFDDDIRVYSEAELLQPLVDAGSIRPRVVQAQERLEEIVAAVVGFAVADNGDPDGASTPAGCSSNGTNGANSDVHCACGIGCPPVAPLPSLCTACTGQTRRFRRRIPFPDTDANGTENETSPATLAGQIAFQDLGLATVLANIRDPWGNPFRYRIGHADVSRTLTPPDLSTTGVWSGAAGPFVVRIWSRGPDGTDQSDVTTADGCAGDDICREISVNEMLGILVGAGVPTD